MLMNTSSTGRTRNALMFMEEKMRKEEKSSHGIDTMVPIRDGRSSILMKLNQFQRKVSMKSSDSMLTDHSTLSQDCQ